MNEKIKSRQSKAIKLPRAEVTPPLRRHVPPDFGPHESLSKPWTKSGEK